MKQLPAPNGPITYNPDYDNHTPVACQKIDLPGRFPIFTDGQEHDLDRCAKLSTSMYSQAQEDARMEQEVVAMVRCVLSVARKALEIEGRNPLDWKSVVMIAVHHKGQATDFWFGDGPEKHVKVDQNLPENLRKPLEGERVQIEKR